MGCLWNLLPLSLCSNTWCISWETPTFGIGWSVRRGLEHISMNVTEKRQHAQKNPGSERSHGIWKYIRLVSIILLVQCCTLYSIYHEVLRQWSLFYPFTNYVSKSLSNYLQETRAFAYTRFPLLISCHLQIALCNFCRDYSFTLSSPTYKPLL